MTLESSDPEVAGPQAEPAVTPRPQTTSAMAVLDDGQRALLRAVLNRLVPAHETLPGAGDLDVGVSIEGTLANSSRLRRLFLDGLSEITITAQQQGGSEFVDLEAALQTTVLKSVEQHSPTFFAALVDHTYRGYYTLAAVQVAVGFEPRPPQPLGHQLPPFDPALLDQQRRRMPLWRPAE